MIPNLQPDTTYAVHLRAPSSSGGKDWIGSVTANGEIHTYWGKTGQINQHAAKPGDISGLLKIIGQKQNGRSHYKQVDEYTPEHGWQSMRHQAQTETRTPASQIIDLDHGAPAGSIQWDF